MSLQENIWLQMRELCFCIVSVCSLMLVVPKSIQAMELDPDVRRVFVPCNSKSQAELCSILTQDTSGAFSVMPVAQASVIAAPLFGASWLASIGLLSRGAATQLGLWVVGGVAVVSAVLHAMHQNTALDSSRLLISSSAKDGEDAASYVSRASENTEFSQLGSKAQGPSSMMFPSWLEQADSNSVDVWAKIIEDPQLYNQLTLSVAYVVLTMLGEVMSPLFDTFRVQDTDTTKNSLGKSIMLRSPYTIRYLQSQINIHRLANVYGLHNVQDSQENITVLKKYFKLWQNAPANIRGALSVVYEDVEKFSQYQKSPEQREILLASRDAGRLYFAAEEIIHIIDVVTESFYPDLATPHVMSRPKRKQSVKPWRRPFSSEDRKHFQLMQQVHTQIQTIFQKYLRSKRSAQVLPADSFSAFQDNVQDFLKKTEGGGMSVTFQSDGVSTESSGEHPKDINIKFDFSDIQIGQKEIMAERRLRYSLRVFYSTFSLLLQFYEQSQLLHEKFVDSNNKS